AVNEDHMRHDYSDDDLLVLAVLAGGEVAHDRVEAAPERGDAARDAAEEQGGNQGPSIERKQHRLMPAPEQEGKQRRRRRRHGGDSQDDPHAPAAQYRIDWLGSRLRPVLDHGRITLDLWRSPLRVRWLRRKRVAPPRVPPPAVPSAWPGRSL